MPNCIRKRSTRNRPILFSVVTRKLVTLLIFKSISIGIRIPMRSSKAVFLQFQETQLISIFFCCFRCDRCEKTYTKRASLIIHQKKHFNIDNKQFVCELCGKVLEQQYTYTRHMAKHAEAKRKLEYEKSQIKNKIEKIGDFIVPSSGE